MQVGGDPSITSVWYGDKLTLNIGNYKNKKFVNIHVMLFFFCMCVGVGGLHYVVNTTVN